MALTLFLCMTSFSYSQEKTIKGTVVSIEDNIPLPESSIVLKGTSKGVTTDFDGKYSIVANKGDILVFSYIGYLTQEVSVVDQSVIDVKLVANAQSLDEIVVIGYGKSSKKLLSSSISSVSSKELNDLPVSDIGSALQGKTTGVTIQTGNGQPGSAPNIVIRGGSSINKGSSPLFIIDGIQRSADDFNPDDVETMQVFKRCLSSSYLWSKSF